MATVAEYDENNQTQNGQQPSANPVPPTTGGNGGAAGAAGGTSSGAPGASGAASPVSNVSQNVAPQNGQGYTDVGAYLNANQAGSQQLGNQVGQNLTNGYNTTKGQIDTSANNLINQVNQGYTQGNEGLIQQAAADPAGFLGEQTTGAVQPIAIQQGAAPTTAAPNNNLAAFQAQLNDTYAGPTSWADTATNPGYGTLQGDVSTAQQNAALTNTPGGLNVLAQQVEQPSTSAGSNQLDALLLGGSPGAMNTIQQAASPYAGLNAYLDSQNQTINGDITNAGTAAQNVSQNALNAFTGQNGTLTNLNNAVGNTVTQDQAQAQQLQQEAQAMLANPGGTATDPAVLQMLGISPQQWAQLQTEQNKAGQSTFVNGQGPGNGSAMTQAQALNFDPGLSLTDPNTVINANTVSTPQQMQEMAAIQQLLGGQTPQGSAINPALASLAGTYNPSQLGSFDYNAANAYGQGALTNAQAEAQQQANAVGAAQQAQHIASQHNGGVLGGIGRDLSDYITHPLDLVGLINPLTWGPNAVNVAKGDSTDATDMTYKNA